MAYEFYVTIEGQKQGKFKGESVREKHKDKIAGLKFGYELKSPRDIASGQASGKRQHYPVVFTKEWGAASPQLFQACATNEALKNVLFEFIITNSQGQEEIYHTIKLTNAHVANIKQYTGSGEASASSAKHTSDTDTHELEEVALTFQKIEVENKPGKTTAMDDWHVS